MWLVIFCSLCRWICLGSYEKLWVKKEVRHTHWHWHTHREGHTHAKSQSCCMKHMKIAFCVIKSRVYLRCVRSENWFTLQFYDFIKNYALFCIYLQYTHSYTHTGTHIYVFRIRRVGKLKQQETQLCTLEQNMQSKRATHTQTTVQGATVCVCVCRGVCALTDSLDLQ